MIIIIIIIIIIVIIIVIIIIIIIITHSHSAKCLRNYLKTKDVEQYLNFVMMFILLHKVVLTFESVDESVYNHSKGCLSAVNCSFMSFVSYAVQSGSNF